VPSNTAEWVAGEILSHGRVRRRVFGIAAGLRRLPRQQVRELDLLADQVVEVMDIDPHGVAARAGMRAGDLIVAMNDRLVASVDDLHRLLARWPIDAAVELTIVRGERRLNVTIDWQSAS
jgi:S1-C subfamily serine protease